MTADRNATEYMTYENEACAFRLKYMEGWTLTSPPPGIVVKILAPGAGKEDTISSQHDPACTGQQGKEHFEANLNVVCHRVLSSQQFGLDMIRRASQQHLEKILGDFKMLSVEDAEVSGLAAKRLEYTGTMRGTYRLNFMQYVTMRADKAYALTYTALQESFQIHKQDIEDIVKSFEVF